MKKKERNFLTGTFILVIFLGLLAFGIGIKTELPVYLFGKFDTNGNIIKDNTIYGEYAKLVGAFLGGMLVLIGLWINNKRILEQTRQNEIAIEGQRNVIKQIQLAEKAQLNTRFKDAAQLLAQDNTSANLSGIYALHQIAIESSNDESQKDYIRIVHEILCAFIRENSIINWDKDEKEILETKGLKPKIIIQTIVNALFNSTLYSEYKTDLSRSVFVDLDFEGKNLSNVTFFRSVFENVDFSNVFLSKAFCYKTRFNNTTFFEAYLKDVDFRGASLKDSNFDTSDLYNIDFRMANLEQISATESYFENVKLGAANINGFYLDDSSLKNVNFSRATLVSVDFYNVDLEKVDFTKTVFPYGCDFDSTLLANYEVEEITRDGRSLELTSTDNSSHKE